jgi:hypothetical protein
MSHDPKLEIYKLKLFKKENNRPVTFRELFGKKFAHYPKLIPPITESDIFRTYHEDFIKQIDKKGYHLNKRRKKGFTIAYDEVNGKRKSHISSPLATDMILSGILQGGKHDIERWLGNVDDKNLHTPITRKHIVSDRFYFLIYTPLDHHEGILMVQGYTETKISDAFRDHLEDYFRHLTELKSKFEIFVPEQMKEKYLSKALFKSLKFSTVWSAEPQFGPDNIKQKEYDLEISIEIVDKTQKKSNYKGFKAFLEVFGKSIFKLEGSDSKKLVDFPKKQAKMSSNGKDFPIIFDDEDNIKPVILLKNEGINVNEGQVPNFDEIDKYCRNLLKDISGEIMPNNAVQEL